MIDSKILQKLEWHLITQALAQFCQTEEARQSSLHLSPRFTREEILENWNWITPMVLVAQESRQPPIGDLFPISGILRATEIGQVLDALQIAHIGRLLDSTYQTQGFLSDESARCAPFAKISCRLDPIRPLARLIRTTVDAEGTLLDEASPELAKIRRQKRNLRTRVEQKLRSILADSEMEKYLQDDFFTVRSERYVIPMRVDGRGRIPGSILDTSVSGQTLFVEPTAIRELNEQLQDLDLAEKLEILRIFRELTQLIGAQRLGLALNYETLVQLDFCFAQAALAHQMHATAIELPLTPCIDLLAARHPLITPQAGGRIVANHIALGSASDGSASTILLISGPNAGGKTVILKTVGLCILLAKAGLLLPVNEASKLFLFDTLYVELGDAQSLTDSLSTFSGHIKGLEPIVRKATAEDLVLLDELAVGTEPHTGAALAQAILEELAARNVKTIVTTHYDSLKVLALQDNRFRNGSMEYAVESLTPTYRLILDQPGQSYGIEVAEKMGLATSVVERAKVLKGESISELEHAIAVLNRTRQELDAMRTQCTEDQREALEMKARWENEMEAFQKSKKTLLERLTSKHQEKLERMEKEFYRSLEAFKKAPKTTETTAFHPEKKETQTRLLAMKESMGALKKETAPEPPGKPARWEDLHIFALVWVVPLGQKGKIHKLGATPQDLIEITVEAITLKVKLADIRLIARAPMGRKK